MHKPQVLQFSRYGSFTIHILHDRIKIDTDLHLIRGFKFNNPIVPCLEVVKELDSEMLSSLKN